jgi:16S rRNA (adenine1518-N6/adenine1519-N6)-dimethyltransferase
VNRPASTHPAGAERPAAAPHRARKRFGQHFLEPAWVSKLVAAMAPAHADVFLEIGPGRGALTAALAPRVSRLLAVEIDRDLAAALPARVPSNVAVVEGDFLEADLASLLTVEPGPIRVAGNLPYNVATPILFKLLAAAEGGRVLSDATVMLQKEVAERVVARPGSGDYGSLALHVELGAEASLLLTLPPGAFRPPPKVTSAVVSLRFRPAAVDIGDVATFEIIVRGVFAQRRKTILNALRPVAARLGRSAADLIARAGVDPQIRPGELPLAAFAALARAVL